MSSASPIYQLKVRLLGLSPMIWRRVLVSDSTTLRELHGILQVAMGWEGIHLFLFEVHAVQYGSFELHAGNPDVSLQQFGFRENERFSYVYDMGNNWEHEIRVEAINPPPKKTYPACIGGSGACPPDRRPCHRSGSCRDGLCQHQGTSEGGVRVRDLHRQQRLDDPELYGKTTVR